jgi:hypothetical protein
MKHTTLGLAGYRTPLVPMESTERDASAPMGLWEFASHIRTVTGMGTTIRLVALTVLTERGASAQWGCGRHRSDGRRKD